MFLVGLTGGIATGKSTVAKMLQELGCPLVDADLVARQVVEPGKPAWKKIRRSFGPEVILENGTLDREKLGHIIFTDPGKRKLLNSITHPEIYKAMMWTVLIYFLKGEQFVILDLPLLFESARMLPYVSYCLVVSCDKDTQIERLKKRNNLTTTEALQRIDAQMSLDEKCQRATHIINNSHSLENTQKQVEQFYLVLKKSRKHWKLRILCLLFFGGLLGASAYFLYKIKY